MICWCMRHSVNIVLVIMNRQYDISCVGDCWKNHWNVSVYESDAVYRVVIVDEYCIVFPFSTSKRYFYMYTTFILRTQVSIQLQFIISTRGKRLLNIWVCKSVQIAVCNKIFSAWHTIVTGNMDNIVLYKSQRAVFVFQ